MHTGLVAACIIHSIVHSVIGFLHYLAKNWLQVHTIAMHCLMLTAASIHVEHIVA